MQGNQRQQGSSSGKGGSGGGNGSPGRRTLTMSLPPRRGGSSSSSSSDDEFRSFSDDSDEELLGERARAQRDLLDSAISPHLPVGDEDEVLPPDEQALFEDDDEWAEVREVEAETEERAAQPSPEEVHSGWRSKGWKALMFGLGVATSVGSSLYNRTIDVSSMTYRVNQWLIGYLNSTLNVTDAAITNLRIDGGLITADTVSAGPLAANAAGYSILCGGFTLAGFELELTLTDIYNLYNGQKPSDSVTLRFGSIAVPLLQVGTAGAQAQPQPSTAPSQPSQAQPSSAKPLPENVRTLLAALRLGVHLGTIDVQLHSQTEDGFTCSVTIEHGALRVRPDSGAFKAVKHLTRKHVMVDGKLHTTAELRAHVRSLEQLIRESPYGMLHQRTLDAIPDQIRAGLLEDGFTDEDREVLQALIEHIGGDRSALFDCDQAIKERATKKAEDDVEPKAKQREETARRIEELGDRYQTGGAAGRFRLHDIHGGVVGSQFAADAQTRGELHVGGVHAEGVNATVAGFDTKVKRADVGPLDLRLVDDQVGVHLDGAKVSGAEAWGEDGTGGFVEKLEIGETRASARTGDVLHPSQSVEGAVHLGAVTAKGGGGTSGDLATLIDRASVGPSEVAVHKRGDQQRVDASGLEVDVGHVIGALDANTAFSASHLHLAPSTVHGERTPSDASDDGVRTGATVQVGALDAEGLSVSQPKANVRVGADQLHVGSIGGTAVDDPAATQRAGAFQLGAINAHGVSGASGAMGGSVAHAFVGPTKVGVDKHGDDARLDVTGLGINLNGVGGTLDADTPVSAESLRAEPSAIHGERKGGVTGGSVTTGAIDLDKVTYDQRHDDQHARMRQLHVGRVTASKQGDQAAVGLGDLAVTKLRGASGARTASVDAIGVDKVHAGGDLVARDGQLHLGTLTARGLDARQGRGDGAPRAHADQIVVEPTDAHVGPGSATFANQGIHVHGVDVTGGGGAIHAGTVETGLLEGEYGPRVDAPDHDALDLHLEQVSATQIDAGQLTTDGVTDTATELHLGGVELHELHGRALDDGRTQARLGGASLTALELQRQRQARDAEPATPQDWHVHEDRLHLGHAGVDRVALERPDGRDVPDGRRDLELKGVDLRDADLINRDVGDRHDHLERKAKLDVDYARGRVEAEQQIAQRKLEEAQAARQLPPLPDKKPSSTLGKVEHKVTSGVKKLFGRSKAKDPSDKEVEKAQKSVKKAEQQLASAEQEARRVERKQQAAAEKEARTQKEARTKDRGAHHHVGSLTLDSFEAELSGFDDDAPTVDAAELGTLEGTHLAESKLLDQLDELTADIHEMKVDVGDDGHGEVTVRIQLGKRAMKNLVGKKLGAIAGAVTGLQGNVLTLSIPVADGVIQLADSDLGTSHNWLRSQLVKRLAKLHVGGDKSQKSLRGLHSKPHVHIPLVGDQQLEHLGLGGLHQDDKKILVSRNVEESGGGVHLGNLLEAGLQTAIDRGLGAETEVHGLSTASVSGVSVDGVDGLRRDGARPGETPVDDVRGAVGKAAVGRSELELDSVETVRTVMASLAGMLAGNPTAPSSSEKPMPQLPITVPQTGGSDPTAGMLDGLFSVLESLLGGQGADRSSPRGKPSGGASSSTTGKPRLSSILTNGTATEHVTAFQTGGGGDCGIHAMFGAPTGPSGTVRAANPNAQRQQLADHLDGTDGQHQAHVDQAAFTQLIAELVLQILTHQGGVGLEAKAFARIAGFFEDMELAKQLDDIDYRAHAVDSDQYAMHLLHDFVLTADDAIGFLLREQLIQDVMVSNTESERELRRRLERASGEDERHVIIMKTDPRHLCTLLISNLDVMVGLALSCGAPRWVGDEHVDLQQQHGQLGGNLRRAVAGYIDLLLPAYATVVRTPGYYLHDEDLRLLALINDIELHIFTEHDQFGGQFVEQLTQPGTTRRADVFHAGAHYEQAHHQ